MGGRESRDHGGVANTPSIHPMLSNLIPSLPLVMVRQAARGLLTAGAGRTKAWRSRGRPTKRQARRGGVATILVSCWVWGCGVGVGWVEGARCMRNSGSDMPREMVGQGRPHAQRHRVVWAHTLWVDRGQKQRVHRSVHGARKACCTPRSSNLCVASMALLERQVFHHPFLPQPFWPLGFRFVGQMHAAPARG